MGKRKPSLRYVVTGPGIEDGQEPSYADVGPALSRAVTAAAKAPKDEVATWYVRDSITGNILGYAERQEAVVIVVRNETRKVKVLK